MADDAGAVGAIGAASGDAPPAAGSLDAGAALGTSPGPSDPGPGGNAALPTDSVQLSNDVFAADEATGSAPSLDWVGGGQQGGDEKSTGGGGTSQVTIQPSGSGPNDCVWDALKGAGFSDQEINQQGLVDKVAQLNGLSDPNVVQAGPVLQLPGRDEQPPTGDATAAQDAPDAPPPADGPDGPEQPPVTDGPPDPGAPPAANDAVTQEQPPAPAPPATQPDPNAPRGSDIGLKALHYGVDQPAIAGGAQSRTAVAPAM